MEPRENRPAVRLQAGAPAPFEGAAHLTLTAGAPPKLAKMLLPGERVTFGTAVHPVVLLLPAFYLLLVVALSLGLSWFAHQHGGAWLRSGLWPSVQLAVEVALGAAALGMLVKRYFRFLGLRVVATNRRIFAIRGVIVRRITPLGNTALAASTLSQGFFGRMFGYGSIDLPLADGTPDRFRDVRDALQLYREFQAVANGVDGDEWKAAVRQTIIP